MKKYRLNLDDIEEVNYAPRKRHTHTHNHPQNNYKSVNISYNENHLHNDNHIVNNTNSINGANNNNQHQRHHRHGPPQWTEFGFKQIILMCVFGISMGVILLSFVTNLILTIKQVVTPKIFFPSIIYIIFSFSCAGGIMGTYLVPPHRRNSPFRKNELLIMRVFVPAVMLVVSLLFLLIGGGDNIKSLKEGLNKSEDLCKKNKGLSMEEIYIKTNETTNELIAQKENIKYSYTNNLFCYPNARCVKYNPNTDINMSSYICNSQDFIQDELSKIKCDPINLKENSNPFLNIIKFQKNANLFVNNCIDLNKNLFKTEINLFKCDSEYDLENIKFTKNLSLESDITFHEYLNKKIKNNFDDIKRGREIIFKYENSKYDYDLDCLHSNDYTFSRLLLNIYMFIFYALCIFWIIFGIFSMHRLIKLGIEGKLEFLNDGDREPRQYINNKINNSEDDGEVNKLIIANK